MIFVRRLPQHWNRNILLAYSPNFISIGITTMAKLTTLQKINKTVSDMSQTVVELKELDAALIEISDLKLESINARLNAAKSRASEDYLYLSNKIRGYVAREASLEKLIELAPRMFS